MRHRGFTVVELLIVAGAIALILWVVIQRGIAQRQEADVQLHVTAIQGWVDRMRECGQAQLDFSRCDAATLRQIAPIGWWNGSSYAPAIGGTVALNVATWGGVPSGAITMTHSNVPRAVCALIADQTQHSFNTFAINAVAVKTSSQQVFTLGTATTRCTLSLNTLTGQFAP